MQIDLLVASDGAVGILCEGGFETRPSGVIYDGIEQTITLEFAETFDSLAMNIPLSGEMADYIIANDEIYVGSLVKGRIDNASLLPLMHVNVDYDNVAYPTRIRQNWAHN